MIPYTLDINMTFKREPGYSLYRNIVNSTNRTVYNQPSLGLKDRHLALTTEILQVETMEGSLSDYFPR